MMDVPFGVVNRRLEAAAYLAGVPLSAQFELTARCNFQCTMCYVNQPAGSSEAHRQEISADKWLAWAKEARDMGVLNVLLTGGEPLLFEGFWELYNGLFDLGLVVTLFTNASLIDEAAAARFARRKPFAVYVSLYGGSAETSERVTLVKNSLQMSLDGVDRLLAIKVPVRLRTTIIRENMHDLCALYDHAYERGIPFGSNDYIIPRRDEALVTAGTLHQTSVSLGKNMDRATPEELKAAQVILLKHMAMRTGKETKDVWDKDLHVLVEKEAGSAARYEETPFSCQAGNTAFWVNWEGNMTPCGSMMQPAFDVSVLGIHEAWERLRAACRYIPRCDSCDTCNLADTCDSCPANRLMETGSYTLPHPYLCEMAAIRKNIVE